jgi:hypothetical protein
LDMGLRNDTLFQPDGDTLQIQKSMLTLIYIYILVDTRDLRALWSPPVSLNLVHVLVFSRNYVQVACHIPLESSRGELQLCCKPHLNRRSTRNVMDPQSHGSPNLGNFGTPT